MKKYLYIIIKAYLIIQIWKFATSFMRQYKSPNFFLDNWKN